MKKHELRRGKNEAKEKIEKEGTRTEQAGTRTEEKGSPVRRRGQKMGQGKLRRRAETQENRAKNCGIDVKPGVYMFIL